MFETPLDLGDVLDGATTTMNKKGGGGGRGSGNGGGGGCVDDKKLRYLEESVGRLNKDFVTHAQGNIWCNV